MHQDLWDSVLDADMNFRYWSSLVRRNSKIEVSIKIFIAIMASGTVAAWKLGDTMPGLWKTLSSISAITAIASPIINLGKGIKGMADCAGKWQITLIALEELARLDPELTENENMKKFNSIKKTEGNTKTSELTLPSSRWLLKKAYRAVLTSRGFTSTI